MSLYARIAGRCTAYALATCALALTCACTKKDPAHNDSVVGQAGHLHIDDGGQGRGLPVVFLHSFGGDSSHWSEQLARVRDDRRAVAIDLRGHGRSDAPASLDYAAESLGSDVESVVDALELDRFVLVGHSLGGTAAAAYVATNAERVAGILLVGAPGKSDPAMAEQALSSLDADFDGGMQQYTSSLLIGATPEVAARIRGELRRVPRDQALAIIGAVFQHDPLPALRAYQGPLLIVDTAGSDGPAALHGQLPERPHAVIAGTSHWPHLDKPEAFAPLLDRLIAEAEAAE